MKTDAFLEWRIADFFVAIAKLGAVEGRESLRIGRHAHIKAELTVKDEVERIKKSVGLFLREYQNFHPISIFVQK